MLTGAANRKPSGAARSSSAVGELAGQPGAATASKAAQVEVGCAASWSRCVVMKLLPPQPVCLPLPSKQQQKPSPYRIV
jgi:hypothetical protein